MLRIKRSVQAQFNTEASYLAAQTMAARQGTRKAEEVEVEDAMVAAEKQVGGDNGPAFVAARKTAPPQEVDAAMTSSEPVANVDEIHISDEEDV
jgi:pre-mRNA-splicing factor SYF1